jgi:hypothetical protein
MTLNLTKLKRSGCMDVTRLHVMSSKPLSFQESGSLPSRRFYRKSSFFVLTPGKLSSSSIPWNNKSTSPIKTLSNTQPKPLHLSTPPPLTLMQNTSTQILTRDKSSEKKKRNPPPKPPVHRPALHRTLGNLGPAHDALVLHQPEKLAIARQVDRLAVRRLARLAVGAELRCHGEVVRGEARAGGRHFF